MSEPLVSVILPTRNGGRFLAAALASVADQDYRPLELLVIDDHSTDDTPALVARCPPAVHLPLAGHGLAHGYNEGFRRARGAFIGFQAHDDLWRPGKLTRQVRFLHEHPECDYVVCRTHIFLEPGDALPPGARADQIGRDHLLLFMEAMLFRRAAIDRVGPFDVSFATAPDVDWLARVKDAGLRRGHLEEVLLDRRVHRGNSTFDPARARATNQGLLAMLHASIQRQRGSP